MRLFAGIALAIVGPSLATAQSAEGMFAQGAVAAVLDGFHAAAAAADEEKYFSYLAPDAVFLGTDATERWDVAAFRAYAHPHFEKKKAWSFQSIRRAVTVAASGAVAWFDEDLQTEKLGPCRGSGVLILDGRTWKIAQYNLSVAVPNEKFDAVKKALTEDGPTTRPAK